MGKSSVRVRHHMAFCDFNDLIAKAFDIVWVVADEDHGDVQLRLHLRQLSAQVLTQAFICATM